ncbi:Stealth CR1 domain-containing protein [Saccharophagus degradans]|uniref:Stealth CR1 domain-containing protein n=1 Tax=Saccharophagus degradans TaxID=86304 RepID=A0AAW7X6K3_9GAMM|nr:Stealth CR1 domain-containing protein [Saccharophagus degradans]MDO6423465.1 Stealth CR1 domain-containing protein [Saccharophagus degradans]MDO6606870.1 Stealth CR1 domain-containing protein [Saccharophagus degradans]
MTATQTAQAPIDAVITWVDGSDPKHAAKLEAYLASIGGSRPRAASPSRFHHSGELDYCVTSLLRFAPWLRTIYIVTDEQTPDLIHKLKGTVYEDRVKVVDHKVIFAGFEQHLPSFNSCSISSLLYRIPGLAEKFLYLNDDFALIQPVKETDFFQDGSVVLRGSWRKFSDKIIHKKIAHFLEGLFSKKKKTNRETRVGYLAAQENSARLLGYRTWYFQVPHNPHPSLVSSQREFFESNPKALESNISFPLRASGQFIEESLAAHIELRKKNAKIKNTLNVLQLKPADQALLRIKNKLNRADKTKKTAFVCVQNVENADEEKQKLIFEWLDKRIGTVDELLNANR